METFLRFAAVTCAIAFASACGDSASSGSEEIPDGIDNQRVETGSNSNTGVPSNVNIPSKGETPTPGIPANGNDAMNVRRGATPTPGIPDQETIRRQMERRDADPDAVNRPARTVPVSNSNTRSGDPLGRPRKTNSN